ncbi:MAG: universal stress protein [Pseudomonadota bacterium]
MNVHRILVGLDGSPREALVLAAAQDLALRFDSELLLVRAVGLPPEIPPEAWQDSKCSVKEYLEKTARDGLERCAKELCDTLRSRHTLEVIVATPWEALCLCAQAHEVDLIVVGSHGYGGLDRILGATATRVVNHALCSVFVVRPPEPLMRHSHTNETQNAGFGG